MTGCAQGAPRGSGSSHVGGQPALNASSSAPSSVATSTLIGAPVRISIPAIGVRASVVRLGLRRDGTLDVPTQAMATGWYTGSPTPGRLGPAVIAGHVHWAGKPAIFARLDDLVAGDLVMVSGADDATAVFRVDAVTTYPKNRFPTDLVYGHIDHAGLRLITCGGYDTTSRSYEANVIVFATLVAS
jgi:sortase (surface protein transpeptidase)